MVKWRYIYLGEVDFAERSGLDILELLVATDELLLDELFDLTQDHLIYEQIDWVQHNLVLVFNTIFKLTNCKKLLDHYVELLFAAPDLFITSETLEDFLSLDKDIIYELIKRLSLN